MPKEEDDLGDLDALDPAGEEEITDPTDELEEGDEPESPDEGEESELEEPELAAQPDKSSQQRQPGRRDKRVDALLQRARQSEKQLTESNRRIDELLATMRAGQQQPSTAAAAAAESAAQREARRAQLTPEERIQEDLRESERRITSQFQNLQGATWDQSDRTLFETAAKVDPIYKKWSPRVEQEFQRLRQNGSPAPRETILAYLIGKTMLEGRTGKSSRQLQAERRVKSNTTKPGGARSDVRGERRGGGKSLEERLTDIPL